MTVEASGFIDDIDPTQPPGTDNFSEGDNHLRNFKKSVQDSFPNISGAMTATHTELNNLDGYTGSTAELNLLDGCTASTAELNLNDGAVLRHKVIDIGDWDMDADVFVQVAHGLTLSKIRGISALIRRDDDLFYYDFMAFNGSGTGSHYINASDTNINLYRHTSGTFDSTNYNSTSYNRGWITIQYVD